MSDLEKRSFYSFLGLYIITSLVAIFLIGYWYYAAQKNSLENETFYKLGHVADMKSGNIVMSHMKHQRLQPMMLPADVTLALINTDGKVVEGELLMENIPDKTGYFEMNRYNILVSDAPKEHLGIRYVVVQSDTLAVEIEKLRGTVWRVIVIVTFFIVLIAWMLSKLFMKPVHQRITQIERFINDVTHELNTPIASLSMSSDLALKQGCTEKTLKNISVSTRQLYDIYRSLSYLNFSDQKEISEALDLKETVEKSIDYYRPLAEIKRIEFYAALEPTVFTMPESQAVLLFGNLIGNAIKYSSPGSRIVITLKDKVLKIKDEGIGIEPAKQKEIFEKFKRGTEYFGGFGVGLHIVKSICDTYKIKIELDSKPDEGTEFRFYF
ncbi:MAG: two-component sensor histidine kinase [Sulfurovum sp.]|nr:MAG: two-component sensor histidine kinase [Sulfurovum sp.]